MTSKYDAAKIAAMSRSKRCELYKNALKHREKNIAEAQAVIDLIKASGLPYSEEGGLSDDDPITIEIREIVNSNEAEAAMRKAVADGWPPMAGVDPMLAKALGEHYGAHNQATLTAGYLVAKKMRRLGFKDTDKKSGDLPAHCVAKTARIFKA